MAIEKKVEVELKQDGTPISANGVPLNVPPVMEVPVDKMQSMLDRMDAMDKRLTEKDSEIAALNATVYQTRLQEAKANIDVDKRPRVHFKKVRGKVVIGWPETVGEDKKNELIYSPNNPSSPIGELLKCRYYYIDGTKSDLIDQVELTRSSEEVFARIVENKGNFVVVEFEDKSVLSTPIEVHKKYLNA